jgi:hypothetical protein
MKISVIQDVAARLTPGDNLGRKYPPRASRKGKRCWIHSPEVSERVNANNRERIERESATREAIVTLDPQNCVLKCFIRMNRR